MKLRFLLLFILLQQVCTAQQILMPYRKGNLWGYADTSGKIVVQPQFDETRLFFDNVAYTNVINYKNNKTLMGIIKNTGQIILPPSDFSSYDVAARNFDFYGGPRTYLPVALRNVNKTYENHQRKTWQDSLPVFFFAKKSWSYGKDSIYIFDSTGKQLTQTPVDEIAIFSYIPQTYHFLVKANSKMGVLDEQGKTVIPIIYDKLECVFFENGKYTIIAKKENKYGLVDMQHKIVLPIVHNALRIDQYGYEGEFLLIARKDKQEIALLPNANIAQAYVNGKINVEKDYAKRGAFKLQIEKDYYKKTVTENNNEATEGVKDMIQAVPPPAPYYDDLVKVIPENEGGNRLQIFTENNKQGLKQKDKIVIAAIYDTLFLTVMQKNEQFYIARKKNKYGIINSNGYISVPLMYKSISLLYYSYTNTENYFVVRNKKNQVGVVTLQNKEVAPTQFQQIELHRLDIIYGVDNSLFHCTNKSGTTLFRIDGSVFMKTGYTKMIPMITSYSKVEQLKWLVENEQQQKGIVDSANSIIVPIQYKEIRIFYGETKGKNQYYFKVKNENNKIGLIEADGKLALPVVYDSIYKIPNIYASYENQQKEALLGVMQNNLYGIVTEQNEIKIPIQYTTAPQFLHKKLPYILIEKNNAIGIATFDNLNLIPLDSTIIIPTAENEFEKMYFGILFYKDKRKQENNLGAFIMKDNKLIRKIPANYQHDWGGGSSSVTRRYFRFLALSKKGPTKAPFDYIGYNGVVFFED